LPSSDWNSVIVGVLSKDLNVESADADIRSSALERLSWEMSYASHLGIVDSRSQSYDFWICSYNASVVVG
jgi:hypothetical protein